MQQQLIIDLESTLDDLGKSKVSIEAEIGTELHAQLAPQEQEELSNLSSELKAAREELIGASQRRATVCTPGCRHKRKKQRIVIYTLYELLGVARGSS
jgi:hypothetical protein